MAVLVQTLIIVYIIIVYIRTIFNEKYLKISEVRMIHKSYGRDSGRCGAFTTAVVQKTITTAVVCCSTEDYHYC